MILEYAINFSIGAMGIALVMNLSRMIRGPRTLDRIVAMDTMYINAIAMIVLLSIQLDSMLYFEAALLIAMMGFVGTVALSKFFLRGDIIE